MPPLSGIEGRLGSLHMGDGIHKVRKAVSEEAMAHDPYFSEEEVISGGGVRLGPYRPSDAVDRLSRLNAKSLRATKSAHFAVDTNEEDDVFSDVAPGTGNVSPTKPMSRLPSPPSPEAREDRALVRRHVSASVDPQVLYPPTACVFVANLASVYDDQTLESEVTQLFSQFGTVFVKIKRDGRQMPHAFCQYTRDAEAQAAVVKGRGAIILGRPCRTEMVKANLCYIIFNKMAAPIEVEEAARILSKLGSIASMDFMEPETQRRLRLPQTVIITYRMYDPKRDVVKAFSRNPTYTVLPYDPSTAVEPPTLMSTPRSDFLQLYDKDRRSAYFGNLPPNMTKDVVRSLAEACGSVIDVHLVHKDPHEVPGPKFCFAFVEYSRADMPDDAERAYNNKMIDGYCLRVQRKKPRALQTPERYETVQSVSPLSGRASGRSFHEWSSTSRSGRTQYLSPSERLSNRSHPPIPASPAPLPRIPYNYGVDVARFPSMAISPTVAGSPPNARGRPTPARPDLSPAKAKEAKEQVGAKAATTAAVAAPPQVLPWYQYPPYGMPGMTPYMGGAMTPQTTPGMMYSPFMPPNFYHAMAYPDMFGNVMMPSMPSMPTMAAAGTEATLTTPARSQEKADDSEADA